MLSSISPVSIGLLLCIPICSPLKREDNDITLRQKRSDDVSLVALQTLVQQQEASLQRLQSEVAALKSSQPATFAAVAFSVRFSADAETGIPLSPQALLHFDLTITNVGNGYSTQTGFFTAPFSGVYSFYISFMSVNGASHTRVAIVRQGTYVDYAFSDGHDDFDRGSTQVVLHLARGEQVWARQETGPAVRGGPYTIFTGFLLQAD